MWDTNDDDFERKVVPVEVRVVLNIGNWNLSSAYPADQSLEQANATHIITNMTTVQISSKNVLCPGFPVESSTLSKKGVSVCGCWM